MSLQSRRNSLFKSSISIKSIGDSVQKFSKSLRGARKNADQATKTIRQKNIFKRSLVRNDDLYFRKRQENIRRKDREDELEASSIQGAPKTQGTILGKSTRGFLGRMLDFLGILLIGWAIQNLPRIIKGIEGLIKRISSVTGILSLFVDGIKFVLGGIGTIVSNALSSLMRFDFLSQKKEIEAGIEGATTGLASSVNEINQASAQFQDPESFGLPDPPGFEMDTEQEQDNKEEAAKLESQKVEEPAELKEAKNRIAEKVEKSQEEEGEEEEVVQGDSDDIEGIKNDLEEGLTAGEGGEGGGGGSSSAAAGGADVADPRDELKKKQKEALSSSKKRKSGRNRTRSSSFLETPETVENISQSVTPTTTTLPLADKYDPDFESSVDGKRKVDLSSLVTPSKKEVNIETERKSKNKVMIIEKPMQTASSGGMTSSGSSSSSIPEVRDEQMLMKMQSTSTLKYT
tara:strand:- start:4050 stop:5426 length:1377 start_codon:yes stop_codon:yes gene_type:complete